MDPGPALPGSWGRKWPHSHIRRNAAGQASEPFTNLPGRVLVIGRGLCRSRMPVWGTPGELRLVLLTCLARPRATWSEWPRLHSTLVWWQIASMQRCMEVRSDFCVREVFVIEVVLLVSGGSAR